MANRRINSHHEKGAFPVKKPNPCLIRRLDWRVVHENRRPRVGSHRRSRLNPVSRRRSTHSRSHWPLTRPAENQQVTAAPIVADGDNPEKERKENLALLEQEQARARGEAKNQEKLREEEKIKEELEKSLKRKENLALLEQEQARARGEAMNQEKLREEER
ncbi:hypothetical protein NHX12_025581 [Muraenolepis orangiensis]|uniref:Uncharacterized protein n=1 Tax=Muraenolepis orangiensis TaxID=630683 RepID=A0A9Q0EK88_9TELE|nr:hypothetical protein NHX12_025581 [Muraenolepis orangiensis]